MRTIVAADHKVILIRVMCVFYTLMTTIKINQNSVSAVIMTIIAFFILKKRSKHEEELQSKYRVDDKDNHLIVNKIDNPYRKTKKLNYSELPDNVLKKAETNLLNYYLIDYSYAKSLEGFQVVKSNMECIFAKNSNVWGAPSWNVDIEVEDNIKNCVPSFILFCNFCTHLKLDGYVIELPGWVYGDDLHTFAKIFCKVLEGLSETDPERSGCMDSVNIESSRWAFEFCKITFFITTFSPCYAETHPRYAFGAKNCYILLQPEISFALHDLPTDTPNTAWDEPVTVRDKIRVAYNNAKRPYHIRDTIHYPMVHDMIRPLNNNDEIIKWWLYRKNKNKME